MFARNANHFFFFHLLFSARTKSSMAPSKPMLWFHLQATVFMSHLEFSKVHARLILHGFRLMTKNVT